MDHFVEDKSQLLLPSSSKDLQPRRHFRIPVGPILAVGLLPVPFGFAYNLVMAIATDFERTTYTSCDTFNVFPSASASARSQHKAWMLACWMQFPFHILNAWLHFRFYRRTLPKPARSFGSLVALVMVVNSCNLVVWGSSARSDGESLLHIANALSLFILNAVVMAGTFVCSNYYILQDTAWKLYEQQLSLRLKSGLILVHFSALVLMWICYFIHQKFCMPLGEYPLEDNAFVRTKTKTTHRRVQALKVLSLGSVFFKGRELANRCPILP